MARAKLIVALVTALIGVILMWQNTTPVEAKLLFFSYSMSLTMLLLIAISIGVVLGMVISLMMMQTKTPKDPPAK